MGGAHGQRSFALDLCKSLQVGDVNGDGYTDLICPYDYGSASTATFVQLSDGKSFSGWTPGRRARATAALPSTCARACR